MKFTISYWRFALESAGYSKFEEEICAHSEVDAVYKIQQKYPSAIHVEVVDY